MKKTFKYDLMLLFCVISWGATFPLVKIALDGYVDAIPYMAVRFIIGAATLWFAVVIQLKRRGKDFFKAVFNKHVLFASFLIGLCGAVGMLAQTFGLYTTTASNSAFITGIYVLFIPFIALFWLKNRIEPLAVGGLVFSAVGLLLVCGIATFTSAGVVFSVASVNSGDMLTLICSVLFALQVCLMNHYAKSCDTLAFSTWQVTVVAAVCSVCWLLFDRSGRADMGNPNMLVNLFICGLVASGLASLMLSKGVAKTTPSHAAVILALEPVTGTIAAQIIPNSEGIRESLTLSQGIGCVIILASILTVEYLSARRLVRKSKEA